MRTIKLYAHKEHEEREYVARQIAEKDPSITAAEVEAILERRPLYEVEFTFDVDTGKCVQANVDGVILIPEGGDVRVALVH